MTTRDQLDKAREGLAKAKKKVWDLEEKLLEEECPIKVGDDIEWAAREYWGKAEKRVPVVRHGKVTHRYWAGMERVSFKVLPYKKDGTLSKATKPTTVYHWHNARKVDLGAVSGGR